MLLSSSNTLSLLDEIRKSKDDKIAKDLLDKLKDSFPLEREKEYLDEFYPSTSKNKENKKLTEKLLKKVPNADLKLCNIDLYCKLLPLTKLLYSVEKNGIPEEHAYKLSVIFENEEKAFSYLMSYARKNKNTQSVMHDACNFALPQREFDIRTWRKLCAKYLTEDPFRNLILPQAYEIESLIRASSPKKKLTGDEIKKISDLVKKIESVNAKVKDFKRKHGDLTPSQEEEYQKLSTELLALRTELTNIPMHFNDQLSLTILNAFREKSILTNSLAYKYFLEHGLTKKDFTKFMDLKRQDNNIQIPDITIDGTSIGYPGYYLKKINVMDEQDAARAACLGKLTACCQSLSGEAGEPCVIHGLTSPYGGFYIVCEGDPHSPKVSDKIVSQCWAWRSQKKALVFDSIETSNDADPKLATDFFRCLATKLVFEGHTNKVACGSNSGISSQVGAKPLLNSPEKFIDYDDYCDSTSQLILFSKNEPFYFYGVDEEQSKATVAMLEEALKNPRMLVESVGFRGAINWSILNKKQDLLNKIQEITKEKYPDRLPEVDTMLRTIEYCIYDAGIGEILGYIENNTIFVDTVISNNGETLLQVAASDDEVRLKTILAIIKKGADIHVKNYEELTALMHVAITGRKEIALALINSGAGVDIEDDKGGTALMYAAIYNNKDVALALIEHGANVNAKEDNDITSLMYAAKNGNTETALMLIENKADINAKDVNDRTPLIYATKKAHTEMVLMLIEKGADVNVKDADDNTALIYAVETDNKEIAMALIENKADINAINNDEKSALLLATLSNAKEIAFALIKNGADVNTKYKDGMTALMSAAFNGHKEIALKLLEAGADVNAIDDFQQSALICAALNGHKEIVLALLKKGANVNGKNINGATALMCAALNGHKEIVLALIDAGANLDAKNSSGETALMIATSKGHRPIASEIMKKMADINIPKREEVSEENRPKPLRRF